MTDFIDNSDQLNMSRAIISPILRSTRLFFTACGIMHRRCCLSAQYHPKPVELIRIINKICHCCVWFAIYITVSMKHGHTNIKKHSVYISSIGKYVLHTAVRRNWSVILYRLLSKLVACLYVQIFRFQTRHCSSNRFRNSYSLHVLLCRRFGENYCNEIHCA